MIGFSFYLIEIYIVLSVCTTPNDEKNGQTNDSDNQPMQFAAPYYAPNEETNRQMSDNESQNQPAAPYYAPTNRNYMAFGPNYYHL